MWRQPCQTVSFLPSTVPNLATSLPFLATFAIHNTQRQVADPHHTARIRHSRGDDMRYKMKKRQKRQCSPIQSTRSEEHTSELQSHVNLVCRLLLEKKK